MSSNSLPELFRREPHCVSVSVDLDLQLTSLISDMTLTHDTLSPKLTVTLKTPFREQSFNSTLDHAVRNSKKYTKNNTK